MLLSIKYTYTFVEIACTVTSCSRFVNVNAYANVREMHMLAHMHAHMHTRKCTLPRPSMCTLHAYVRAHACAYAFIYSVRTYTYTHAW